MSVSRFPLSPATVLLMVLAGTARVQAQDPSAAPAPDWNSTTQQTTSPSLQRQLPARTNRLSQPRNEPPAAAYQGNPESLTGAASSGNLQPLRSPPALDLGPPNPQMTLHVPVDQQLARMQQQIRELQQRLMAAEQTLVSHVHTFETGTYRKEKYRTMKYFLENNLEYEYLVPGGHYIQKETSAPMVSAKRPWP